MKNNRLFSKLSLLFITSLIFISCKNPFSQNGKNPESQTPVEYTVQGKIAFDGAVPNVFLIHKDSSRSAAPSFDETNQVIYKITAYKKTASGDYDYTTPNVTSNYNSLDSDYFEIKLTKGTWKLKAEGYLHQNETTGEYENQLFSGLSDEVTLTNDDDTTPSVEATIKVSAISGDPDLGTGTVELRIEVPETVYAMKAVWKQGDVELVQTITKNDVNYSSLCFSFNMEDDGDNPINKDSFGNVNIPVNYYPVNFYFYESTNETLSESEKNALLAGPWDYYCHETINVFLNFKTDTWVKSSLAENASPWLQTDATTSTTIFTVTDDLISSFISKSYFVRGTQIDSSHLLTLPGTANDDNKMGTPADPLATITEALSRIKEQNKKDSASTPYTIFIDGECKLPDGYTVSEDSNAWLDISPLDGSESLLDVKLCAYNSSNGAKLNANGKARAIYVDGAKLTLENITVTGGLVDEPGAGVFVTSNENSLLQVNGAVVIKDNYKGTVSSNSPSNVYLKCDDETPPEFNKIKILGSLLGSEIGVQIPVVPTKTNPDVIFTDGFAFTNGTGNGDPHYAAEFFTSDDGFSLGISDSETEAALVISGGTINQNLPPNIQFFIDKTSIENKAVDRHDTDLPSALNNYAQSPRTITITAKKDVNTTEETELAFQGVDSPFNPDKYQLFINPYGQPNLPSIDAGIDDFEVEDNAFTYTFPRNYPAGKYEISLKATYNNGINGTSLWVELSPSFVVTVEDNVEYTVSNTTLKNVGDKSESAFIKANYKDRQLTFIQLEHIDYYTSNLSNNNTLLEIYRNISEKEEKTISVFSYYVDSNNKNVYFSKDITLNVVFLSLTMKIDGNGYEIFTFNEDDLAEKTINISIKDDDEQLELNDTTITLEDIDESVLIYDKVEVSEDNKTLALSIPQDLKPSSYILRISKLYKDIQYDFDRVILVLPDTPSTSPVVLPESVANSIAKLNYLSSSSPVKIDMSASTETDLSGKYYFLRKNITSLVLPASLQFLDSQFWENADDLEEINISPDNPYFTVEDGILYNKDKTKIIKYPQKKQGTSYTLPDFCTEANYEAFYNCTYLQEITNLSQIDSIIDMCVFRGSAIITAELNSNLTTIPYYTFEFCTNLENVILPSKLNWIGIQSFDGCTSLSQITIPSSVTTIQKEVFNGCTSLSTVTFENTSGWKCNGSDVDVSNPATNAENFKNTSSNWCIHGLTRE